MRASMARLLQFSGVLAVAACGGGDPSGPGTPWVGDWELTLENGVVPSGYASTLTIQTGSFTSTFVSAAQSCSWSGTLTATSTEITWSYDSATGPPCNMAVGTARTSTWTLSGDGETLTLDFTADGGALQVWSRT